MSSEIIGALILAGGALLGILLKYRLDNQKTSKVPSAVSAQKDEFVTSKPLTEEPIPEPVSVDAQRCFLSHSEIVQAIESQAPYQEQSVHDSFVGHQITWSSTLQSISRHGDSVTVMGSIPVEGHGCLFCKTSKKEAQIFNLVPKKTSFLVTGTIERINRFEVDLNDCTFEIRTSAEAE
ncbi:hypothetical protein [Puniceicoccus vermicola]|uniref:Uncharacterized protein n=1 Tax=Puniceicoccus vermicola TaxID=388746 RepID=A0A7X1AY21_9BACT|nr:hypothetical protein [Puniceicoccus vermicola]MBC2602093.1 hypothetical protein [Puniceicoccus vermicola]